MNINTIEWTLVVQLYREGKLYSSLLILFEFIQAPVYIFHALCLLHIIMSSIHPLLRVVTESEEVTVNQVPEEEDPPVEVGFDICGSSEEPNTSTNQGKPCSI